MQKKPYKQDILYFLILKIPEWCFCSARSRVGTRYQLIPGLFVGSVLVYLVSWTRLPPVAHWFGWLCPELQLCKLHQPSVHRRYELPETLTVHVMATQKTGTLPEAGITRILLCNDFFLVLLGKQTDTVRCLLYYKEYISGHNIQYVHRSIMQVILS